MARQYDFSWFPAESFSATVEFSPVLLRLFREIRGMPRAELARRCGITERYLQDLEYGKRRRPALDLIANLGLHLGIQFQLFPKVNKS